VFTLRYDSDKVQRMADNAHLDNGTALSTQLPSSEGLFGAAYGGAFLPPPLVEPMKAVEAAYIKAKVTCLF
jgi:hypothetical protein